MHKKRLVPLIAVVGLVGAVAAAWWLQRPAGPAPAGQAAANAPAGRAGGGGGGGAGGPAAVEVGTVRQARLVDDVESVGSLRARRSVVLRPEVSGRVTAIGFNEGQPVRRGQLLVQLDDTLAQAQLRQAQAQAALASSQLNRNRELLAQNYVSRNAVDQSEAALEVAQAQVALAQAQVARLKVLAPFDALAGVRRVQLGDFVKDGADLVSLEDLSEVWVDFRLPERFLAQVRAGQRVEVTVDAFGDRLFPARVETLDSQVDVEGRSLLVRARLLEREPGLKPGMFARTRTVLSARNDALVVPEEALVPQGGKQFLILVVDGPKGPVSRRIEASLGTRQRGQVEIVDGVKAGDRVVTAGHERLLRGDSLPVRIVEVGTSGAPKAASAAAPAASAAPRTPA